MNGGISRLDICLPNDFLRKCLDDYLQNESRVWRGMARNTISLMVFEGEEENVSTIHTSPGPDGTFFMSFSDVCLHVLEGQCGLSLKDIRTDGDSKLSNDVGKPPRVKNDDSETSLGEGDIVDLGREKADGSCEEDVKMLLNFAAGSQETVPVISDENLTERKRTESGKSTVNETLETTTEDDGSALILSRKSGRKRGRKPKSSSVPKTGVEETKKDIRGKRYMLRGVKTPQYLIDRERETEDERMSEENEDKRESLHVKKRGSSHLSSEQSKPNYTKYPQSKRRKKLDLGSIDMPKFERRKRNNSRVAQCKYCKKLFCDFTGVGDHVKKFHADENDIECYFSELKKLKIVKCKSCDATLQNRYLLQDHEDRVHFKVTKLKCDHCGKIYKNLKSLRNHIRSVHFVKGKPHLCHLCPAKFKWATTLKQHIEEIHEGIRDFCCKFCGKEFHRKSQLTRHERIHGTDASKRIVCSLCGKGFWFANNYHRHLRVMHQPQEEKFHCSYCGRGFHQKNSMVTHVQLVHFNLYTFTCKLCKTGFTRSKNLQAHMSQFHDKTDFVIVKGPHKRFKYNRTAEDLLYCSYCSKGFYYKAKLVEHMHQEHASEFPHKCEDCNQGFLEKKYLNNHLKKAHSITVELEDDTDPCENGTQTFLSGKGAKKQQKCSDSSAPVYTILPSLSTQTIAAPHANKNTFEVTAAAASLLVEVANSNNTIHYVIQHAEGQDCDFSKVDTDVQDIASLLLVAEQASVKESLPMITEQEESSLVADNDADAETTYVNFITAETECIESQTQISEETQCISSPVETLICHS